MKKFAPLKKVQWRSMAQGVCAIINLRLKENQWRIERAIRFFPMARNGAMTAQKG